jgi:hypothetical protein
VQQLCPLTGEYPFHDERDGKESEQRKPDESDHAPQGAFLQKMNTQHLGKSNLHYEKLHTMNQQLNKCFVL